MAESSSISRGAQIGPGMRLSGSALHFRFARSSGPGGQNVNKLNTKAMLHVDLAPLCEVIGPAAMGRLRRLAARQMTAAHLVITSEEHRSQLANRRACLEKLRTLVARARTRSKPRKVTRPGAASVERRLKAKQHRARIKHSRRRGVIEE